MAAIACKSSTAQKDALTPDDGDSSQLSRMACSFCRVRKLKCDKRLPICGSCSRYRHQCVYESIRKVAANRSRKKGYVSALQERLAQIETSLSKQSNQDQNELLRVGNSTSIGEDGDEDLVSQETIREIEDSYFQKIHESVPMIHKARYKAAAELDLALQPPIYLRHAILALGACASPKHSELQERFYRSSREALEFLEMNDDHTDMVSVEQAQTWILIATYEFIRMYFHRSWLSTGRAVRLVQMMGLHCMDQKSTGPQPPLLTAPKDWTTGEERRRAFWLAFCLDSYAAIGHGWPMTVNEQDIVTRLPAPDEAYQSSTETTTIFLQEATTLKGSQSLSPFAGVVVITAICSQRITSLRRHNTASRSDHWRNGSLDIALFRPILISDHLKALSFKWDPNLCFLNMFAHASTIRIHHEAVAKTGESLHSDGLRDSELIQLESAMQIANIMRASCHVDLSTMNPFTSFCLYVAATALARTKTIQLDENQKNSLQFLLTAMNYLEEIIPLTSTFIRDLEEEFPDLTASLLTLDVEKTPVSETEFASKPVPHHTRVQKSGLAPTLPPSNTPTGDLYGGFASSHSILSHEWSVPDDLQVNFDDIENSAFDNMNYGSSKLHDDSFGGLFVFPRTF